MNRIKTPLLLLLLFMACLQSQGQDWEKLTLDSFATITMPGKAELSDDTDSKSYDFTDTTGVYSIMRYPVNAADFGVSTDKSVAELDDDLKDQVYLGFIKGLKQGHAEDLKIEDIKINGVDSKDISYMVPTHSGTIAYSRARAVFKNQVLYYYSYTYTDTSLAYSDAALRFIESFNIKNDLPQQTTAPITKIDAPFGKKGKGVTILGIIVAIGIVVLVVRLTRSKPTRI